MKQTKSIPVIERPDCLRSLPEHSRLWIYVSDRPIAQADAMAIRTELHQFARGWVSHQQQLAACAELVAGRIIVLAVDEQLAGASGCSIDSSVHFLQGLEQRYSLSLLDRMQFAYFNDDELTVRSRAHFAAAYQQGEINDDTLVVDTLLPTLAGLDHWIKPLGESWHARMV